MKRPKDINWNQVYYFHAVATAGSMTAAALSLGVSLPTVSEQVKKLEDLLETELFRRSTRRIELTESGWDLFNCTREMFAAGIRFFDKVSPNSIGGYAARVGVQEAGVTSQALDFVYRYEDEFKAFGSVNLHRDGSADSLWQRLVKGELDWGIGLETPKSTRLEWRVIDSLEIGFCCSHDVFSKFANKEDIIKSLPLAQINTDKNLNQAVRSHLKTLDIIPSDVVESDFTEYCLGLAARGRCVAPISLRSVGADPGFAVFTVGDPIFLELYAGWARSHENMIAIRQLLALISGSPWVSKADQRETNTRKATEYNQTRLNF